MEEELNFFDELPLPKELVEILSESHDFDNTFDPTPTKKKVFEDTKTNKRRQRNRLSEAKRRIKFKSQFETLKTILIAQSKQERKLTPSEILNLAISKLTANEVLENKQVSPPNDAFSQVVDLDTVFQHVITEETTNLMSFAQTK